MNIPLSIPVKPLLLTALTVAAVAVPFSQAQEQQLPASATVATPIKAGGVVALDLPDSSAQAVSLDIVKGRFADYSVGRITLTGSGIDFRNGTLQGLKADVSQGDFDNLLVDRLELNAPGFAFNTMELLNNRTFVLAQPVTAQVNVQISEDGLNRFIASPRTLDKIEKAIQKKTGGLRLITFSNPHLDLMGGNKVKLNVTGIVAQGMAVPMEMNGKLALRNGQVAITDLGVSSNGTEVPLPVDVAEVFEDKLNELVDFRRLGKDSLVINADTVKSTGNGLTINGHATLTRLKFG